MFISNSNFHQISENSYLRNEICIFITNFYLDQKDGNILIIFPYSQLGSRNHVRLIVHYGRFTLEGSEIKPITSFSTFLHDIQIFKIALVWAPRCLL